MKNNDAICKKNNLVSFASIRSSKVYITTIIAIMLLAFVLPGSAIAAGEVRNAQRPYEADMRYGTTGAPLTDEERLNYRLWAAGISLAIAFVVPAIVTSIWMNQLKSVREREMACDYIRNGSMVLNLQKDIFLYRNVRKVARAQNNSSRGGHRRR